MEWILMIWLAQQPEVTKFERFNNRSVCIETGKKLYTRTQGRVKTECILDPKPKTIEPVPTK